MLTYQDFERSADRIEFIARLIAQHEGSEMVKTAKIADEYDAQRNVTIGEYVQKIYNAAGIPVHNYIASNNKIASNFFRRLNTQRCTYSLGNGVTFARDEIKARLGDKFDTQLKHAGYLALKHGISFVFLNLAQVHVFPLTEFAPLWDEETGALRAGVRYWRVDAQKPAFAVLYEQDGYTRYRASGKGVGKLEEAEPKRAYRLKQQKAPVDAAPEVVGAENYAGLPIVPLWGSSLRQSTLIGLRQSIDSFDLIRSGFANDLQDCAQIYWLLENFGGMSDEDLAQFRDRLLFQHTAVIDTQSGGKVQGYTQEIPYQARMTYLQQIRAGIYEDFGALDVTSISAGSKTATEINAAYQPLDENADDFEYQVIECVQQILALIGAEDTPIFKRNRISNQLEQVQMVMLEAPYLDDETLLSKLPNITPDEIEEILKRKDAEDRGRFNAEPDAAEPPEDVINGDGSGA